MTRYLLDTHIAVWFLLNDKKLSKSIREEIEYFQDVYSVSVVSLQEIVLLKRSRKIETGKWLKDMIADFQRYNIAVLDLTPQHIRAYETLSTPTINGKQHDDPFDRLLIAQSIAEKNDSNIGRPKISLLPRPRLQTARERLRISGFQGFRISQINIET